jgi:hypothetical protein
LFLGFLFCGTFGVFFAGFWIIYGITVFIGDFADFIGHLMDLYIWNLFFGRVNLCYIILGV